MSILNVLKFPDPNLRIIAKPVKKVTYKTQKIINDMLETMYYCSGIGLAATQVNIHEQIVVLDLKDNNGHKVLINPSYVKQEETKQYLKEGCLSIPDFYETIERFKSIKVKALDYNGNIFYEKAEGLLATCIQHEIDHLNGKLFIDSISKLKYNRIRIKTEKENRKRNRK